MALEPNNDESLLTGADATEDDFAALDSMAYTGTQSQQFGMNTVAISSSGSFGAGSSGGNATPNTVGDGRDNGFSGVSGSLFDRIRARTAEQQKQSLSAQPSLSATATHQQEAAQSTAQQSAFMSQQQPQPTSGEPTMEFEKNALPTNNNAFDASVANVGAPTQNNMNNNSNETTYSFSASAGEDFSQAAAPAPHVPVYGASRDDPYYMASNNNQQQQHPATIQDKATLALAQTGETMKTLFNAGMSGAQTIGAMAQDKMAGAGGGSGGGGGRSYNNNFLLREDSLESGDVMHQPPPPPPAAMSGGGETGAVGGGGASDQAYSMFKYGKTFCEDLFGFVMQLPPWGKGLVAVILLWILYVVFG